MDCLYHLVLGMTTKEIAKELSLSHRTVEHYLENTRAKLNCSSRNELVNQALKIPSIKTSLLKA
jgi:DNA-binding CsgD family transcriptional regulator